MIYFRFRLAEIARPLPIAVWAIIALTPILVFPEVLWPIGGLLAVCIALVAMAAAVHLLRPFPVLAWSCALLSLIVTLAWWRAAAERTTLAHFCGVAAGLLTMAVVARWANTVQRVVVTTGVFLIVAAVAVAVGLRSTGPSPSKLLPLARVKALLPQRALPLPGVAANNLVSENPLGAVALLVVLVGGAAASRSAGSPRALRVAAVVATVIGIAGVVITQSRAVLIAAWLTGLVAAVRWNVPWRRRVALLVVIAGLPAVAIATTTLLQAAEMQRLDIEFNSALQSRLVLWREGVALLRMSPWFGIGLNNFRYVAADTQGGSAVHVHNVFLQTALDVGIVGLVVYLVIVGWVIAQAAAVARTSRAPLMRHIAAGGALALVSLHFFGLGDAFALGAKLGGLQWVVSGLIVALTDVQHAPVAAPASDGVQSV